ncbi:hypothetical protein [Paenibacillus uliginis]|uniref:hypothetical protein n=1 Tax=Paenibacillus uliginis TaxID=683737 RepID=UPI001AD7EEDC|nr:hypothetical protein [Paenibacillus uliginis]
MKFNRKCTQNPTVIIRASLVDDGRGACAFNGTNQGGNAEEYSVPFWGAEFFVFSNLMEGDEEDV